MKTKEMAKEALELIYGMLKDGDIIPEPTENTIIEPGTEYL